MRNPTSICSPSRGTLCVLAAVGVLALGFMAARAWAFPKPSVHATGWEMRFEHGIPKRIAVQIPGHEGPEAYWYMTFTVSNPTEEAHPFLPVIEMLTQDGKVIQSDKEILPVVFAKIKETENQKLLVPLGTVSGRVLAGDDQAQDSVAIWREPAPRLGTFSIFVGGLCEEHIIVKDGEVVDLTEWRNYSAEERKGFRTLFKTLQINFQVQGNDVPGKDTMNSLGEEWVMR